MTHRDTGADTIFIECECGDPRDSVIVHRFVGNTRLGWEPELYMDSFMAPVWPWYKRVPHAVRYLFGFEAKKYGHFGCTLISRRDAEHLMDVCRGFCAEFDAYKEADDE